MNCKQCGEAIAQDKREDTLFCNQNCKQKHYKRRKKITRRIAELERLLKSEKSVLDNWKVKLDEEGKKIEQRQIEVDQRLTFLKQEIKEYKEALLLNKQELYNFLLFKFRENEDKFGVYLDIFKFGSKGEKLNLMKRYRENFREQIKLMSMEQESLSKEGVYHSAMRLFKFKTKEQEKIQARIDKSNSVISELETEYQELIQIDIERLPIIPSQKQSATKRSRTSDARAYTGSEIASLNFDSLRLNGALGHFLGRLERNKCAIALTGDSGAGKSTFSFTLSDGFLDLGLSVGYFTLESGFTTKFKEFAAKHQGNHNFKAFEEGTLKDVRTEAENFDCLIIDSYSKISQKAADFEDLRQDFPNTYFIIIFQKTTDGKIRGGSSILFNSTATIDIQVYDDGERVAVMKKSRYDTENFIYSISNDRMIKADKLPL
ncbi:MAG: DUF713 domain-containing protein [bacterium]|nr:DUF713 domain-containing protein [bacterium]